MDVPRIPTDKFHAALYRRHIQAALSRWPDHLSVSLAAEVDATGAWSFSVGPADIRPGELFERAAQGIVWLEEDDGDVIVVWRIGEQSNTADYVPILPFS